MAETRVVITGLGLITPIGIGVNSFWEAALRGVNGVGPITSFDTTDFKTKVGGEVRGFVAQDYIKSGSAARMGRSSQFALAAAKMALDDAGLKPAEADPCRVAVSMGTTMGEPQILEQAVAIKYRDGTLEQVPSGLPRQYPCGVIAANVSREFGIRGPSIMIPTACAAGNYAIGYGYDLIQLGRADAVLAGGSDPFSKIAFIGFNRLLATAECCVRPFSRDRDGMAVSEGAAVLVLERLERAIGRGATIYAEVLGYGLACDAHKMTIPDPSGSGGILSLERALRNAKVGPEKVDYVNAHGTGTGENDKTETLIIKRVLGERAMRVPVSSLKSMLGHTMGAASAIEAAATALMLSRGVILPTINYLGPDPDCDLDYVPNQVREAPLNVAVSNAYAFGGNTSSLVLARYRG